MSTKPVIIDTWDYTEGYLGCIMGNEPHSVRDDVAVTVHMRPGETAGRRLRPGHHVHNVRDRRPGRDHGRAAPAAGPMRASGPGPVQRATQGYLRRAVRRMPMPSGRIRDGVPLVGEKVHRPAAETGASTSDEGSARYPIGQEDTMQDQYTETSETSESTDCFGPSPHRRRETRPGWESCGT